MSVSSHRELPGQNGFHGQNGQPQAQGRRFQSGLSHRLHVDPPMTPDDKRQATSPSYPRKSQPTDEEDARSGQPQQWRGLSIAKTAGSTSSTRSLERVPEHSKVLGGIGSNGLADFFSPEVFQIVLHNPTTAFQLLKFSQNRMCGENMEFLEKVDRYNTLLDQINKVMSEIHRSYTAPDATRGLNISATLQKQINSNIKACTSSILPSMELIFAEVQENVEELLATDIYPRFVKYQMTTSATKALSSDRGRYQGLGDCFCLTDPNKADNPIVSASDGFLQVTGYSRTDIIPRNCRFLQGNYTDKDATKRLKASIDASEETVELLLNYRKSGEPFWNLLYVAPLYDGQGNLAYFLGGQINCSTTIRDCSDVLRVLSMSDEPEEESAKVSEPSIHSNAKPSRVNFFKSLRRQPANKKSAAPVPGKVGMEQGLINKIEKMDFRTQMEMFYTAYSKYLVIDSDTMCIEFYSPSIIDILHITPDKNADFVGNDVFKFLSQHTASLSRDFKFKVKESMRVGMAISANINLLTLRSLTRRAEDRFVTHWTPLKDERGAVRQIILTLALTNV